MGAGAFTLSLQALGVAVQSEHPVDPDQRPTGEEDVHHHALDMTFANLVVTPTYFLTDQWFLSSSVPVRVVNTDVDFLGEDREILPVDSSIHHRNETLVGVGDVSLMGGYRVWSGMTGAWAQSVDLSLGCSIPTGSTEPDPFELGRQEKTHQHIMFGSGTLDPVAQVNGWMSDGSHLFSFWSNIRAPLYANQYGMKTGTQISVGMGWLHGFGLQDWRLKIQPEIYHEEPTTWSEGDTSRNSGRTDVVAAVGVHWQLSEHVGTSLTVKKPFTVQVEGGQLDMPLMMALGVNLSFHFGDTP